jgi:hypothetical protein
MSDSKLPERPSLEYLKKLAKNRLTELRRTDPDRSLQPPCFMWPANSDFRAGAH